MPASKTTGGGLLAGLAGLIGLSAVAGVLIAATVTPAIAVTSATASGAINMFEDLPSNLDIQTLMQPTVFYAKDPSTGQYTEMTSYYTQNRTPVTYDEVAPVMYQAILSSEDPRYYEHGGIDLIGTTRALLSNIQGNNVQGGSSISQQYVKNVLVQNCYSTATNDADVQKCYNDATNSSGGSGIQRKLQEMRYAIALEQKYSKNDILVGYLNISNFGGQTYGIEAAAERYFGVHAKDLNLEQAATLAGMVQNPNTYRIDQPASTTNGDANHYALTKQRQTYVLDRMLIDGKISQADHDKAVSDPIIPTITTPKTGCAASSAPYFCKYVQDVVSNDPAFGSTPEERAAKLQKGGLKIYTTIDMNLQNSAQGSMSKYVPATMAGIDLGSTSVTIEPSTGRVLSITQNTNYSEADSAGSTPGTSSLVYAGNSTYGKSGGFPAGSTFKIFTLVSWLEAGNSVNQVIDGRNRVFKNIPTCNGTWTNANNETIGNFEGQGMIGTPMQFTAASINSGFLAMASKIGLCPIAQTVAKMGVTFGNGKPIPMDYGTEVIGVDNVSPMAMAEAFATVANNGIYCSPTVIDKVTDASGTELAKPASNCSQVIDPNVAATAAYALQGVMRGGTGTGGNPYDGTPLLGKTGTNEQTHTWLIESSTKATTAVWVGNANGFSNLFHLSTGGRQLSNLRYVLAKEIQGAADKLYGGDAFPAPDPNLTKQVMSTLPNVVGLTVDQATQQLQTAGFNVQTGTPVDSTVAAGLVAQQDPAAGQVAGGTTVTLSPSTGNAPAVPIPGVSGQSPSQAQATLSSAGFTNVSFANPAICSTPNAKASGTSPGAGQSARPSDPIAITCTPASGGGSGGGGTGGGGSGGTGSG